MTNMSSSVFASVTKHLWLNNLAQIEIYFPHSQKESIRPRCPFWCGPSCCVIIWWRSHTSEGPRKRKEGGLSKVQQEQIHSFVMNLSMQRKHGTTHEGRVTGLNTQQRLLLVKLSQWQPNLSMDFGRDRNITHNKVHSVHQVEIFS